MTNPGPTQYPPWPSLRIQTLAAECLIKIVKKKLAIDVQPSSALSIINEKNLVDAFRVISERASIRKLSDSFRLTEEEQKQLVILDVVAISAADQQGRVDIEMAREQSEAAIRELLHRRKELKDEESISEKLNSLMNDMEIASNKLRRTIRTALSLYLNSKERIELLRIRDSEKAEQAINELNALYKSAALKLKEFSLSQDGS